MKILRASLKAVRKSRREAIAVKDRRCGLRATTTGKEVPIGEPMGRNGKESWGRKRERLIRLGKKFLLKPACADGAAPSGRFEFEISAKGRHRDAFRVPGVEGIDAAGDRKRQEPRAEFTRGVLWL